MSKARQLADLGNVYDDGALSNRNLVINGKFEVNQRNDGSSTAVSVGNSYLIDRFNLYTDATAFAVYSATHEIASDAPDGFNKSLKITCTSGGAVPATGEVVFRQKIEGYSSSVLNYGSANGESATVSFWIKASVTGDYGLQFIYYDGTNNNFYVSKYTVNSANTWEYKTVTIPPQTSNPFDNVTNGTGLVVYWDLGEGSDYSGTADAGWTTTYRNGLSGGVKLMENTGATWQITGVSLEIGDTATPFEHRSYGDELARCQRYFQMTNAFALFSGRGTGTTTAVASLPLTVPMRASPTLTTNGIDTRGYTSAAVDISNGTPSVHSYSANDNLLTLNLSSFDNLLDDRVINFQITGSPNGATGWSIDAEL